MSGASCPRCGGRLETARLEVCARCLLEGELPPVVLGGQVELLEEIGSGGMGTVFRARHLRLGRLVAVKLLPGGLAGERAHQERLEREARMLARINHPNVVTVHDLGKDEDQAFIVMELVEGKPLSELLPLPPARALFVLRQVAEALAHAHGQGILHRDLKPANVLVGPADTVKVADFGIARLLAPESSEAALTGTGVAIGTPAYMAPEARAGGPPDPRMDVYSFAVLAHEVLTGRLPEAGKTALPGALARVLEQALGERPEDRPESVEACWRALEAAWPSHAAALDRPDPAVLPPEEQSWAQAVAVLETLATAVVLWAILLSVTPRVLPPGAVEPLIMVAEALPDGRVVSRARFETGPTLAAVAMVAIGVGGYGLLRRHWLESGLLRPSPGRPIAVSRRVPVLGLMALALYGGRLLLESRGHRAFSPYAPILGGVIEIAVLYHVWLAVLEAWRRSRPLARERLLWLGLGLALVPPVLDLLGYLARWRP